MEDGELCNRFYLEPAIVEDGELCNKFYLEPAIVGEGGIPGGLIIYNIYYQFQCEMLMDTVNDEPNKNICPPI